MKRVMRARSLNKKLTLMATAFVLAVSTLTAAVPFIGGRDANAIAGTIYEDVNPATGWVTDRTTPSGGYGAETFAGRQSVYLNVDAPSNAPTSFYQYEGITKNIPAGSKTLKGDLYIDPTWPDNVRAGFWGVGYDTTNAISSYPIVEYNTAFASHWRIWDSVGLGGWREVAAPSATSGWNTIELAINKTDSAKTDVYVNNTYIGTSATDATDDFRSVILNNYNFGDHDYAVHWSNIQAGSYILDAPTNLTPLTGTSTSNKAFENTWKKVEGAVKYEYTASYSLNGVPQVYSDTSESPNYSFSGDTVVRKNSQTPDSTYTWKVRAIDANGVAGQWSTEHTVTVDTVAPTAPTNVSPANGAIVNGASVTQTWGASASSDVAHYVYESYHDAAGNNLRWHEQFNGTTLSKTATNVADGSYWWRVKAVDAAGNESAWSPLWKVTIDNKAPVVSLSGAADGASYNTPVTITGLVTDVNPSHYFLTVWKNGVVVHISGISDQQNKTSFSYTFANDAAYKLKFEARDLAQNKDDAVSVTELSFTVDRTPITVSADSFTRVGNVITPEVVASETPASQEWSFVSGPDQDGVEISDVHALSPDFTVLQDGTYSFQLEVVDAAGNVSTGIFSFTYTTPPAPRTDDGEGTTGGSEAPAGGAEDGVVDGFTGPTFISQAAGTGVLGASTINEEGTAELNGTGAEDVRGDSTLKTLADAVDANNTDGKALGLAWYWWLIIVAAVLGAVWWLVAGLRRREQ